MTDVPDQPNDFDHHFRKLQKSPLSIVLGIAASTLMFVLIYGWRAFTQSTTDWYTVAAGFETIRLLLNAQPVDDQGWVDLLRLVAVCGLVIAVYLVLFKPLNRVARLPGDIPPLMRNAHISLAYIFAIAFVLAFSVPVIPMSF